MSKNKKKFFRKIDEESFQVRKKKFIKKVKKNTKINWYNEDEWDDFLSIYNN